MAVALHQLQQHLRILLQFGTQLQVEGLLAEQPQFPAAGSHVELVDELLAGLGLGAAQLQHLPQVVDCIQVVVQLHTVQCHLVVSVHIRGLDVGGQRVGLQCFQLVALHQEQLVHAIVDMRQDAETVGQHCGGVQTALALALCYLLELQQRLQTFLRFVAIK